MGSSIAICCLFFMVSLSPLCVDANSPKEYLGIEAFSKEPDGLCLVEHNAYRQKKKLPALSFDKKLETAARKRNDVMVKQQCFSHQCRGEPKLGERVTNEGYEWTRVAENIAGGQRDCKQVMDVWMKSNGHRANILGEFKQVGCALRRCSTANCQYGTYWTCVFAKPK